MANISEIKKKSIGVIRSIFNRLNSLTLKKYYFEYNFESILNEREDSMMLKFINLQREQPSKGDWMSTCMSDLKTLSLTNTLEDLKNMSKEEFKTILKQRIRIVAFQYLKYKQGSKEVKSNIQT